jgi:hypothetical protein
VSIGKTPILRCNKISPGQALIRSHNRDSVSESPDAIEAEWVPRRDVVEASACKFKQRRGNFKDRAR